MRPEEHLEKSGEKATVKFQCSNFSKLWRKQPSVIMLRRPDTEKGRRAYAYCTQIIKTALRSIEEIQRWKWKTQWLQRMQRGANG